MTNPTPFDSGIERNRQRAAEGSVNAMNDLAIGLRDRFRYSGEVADLLAGIACLRRAIGYVPDHPIRHELSVNLSALLLDHFHLVGDLAALREVVARCDAVIPRLGEEGRLVAAMMRADSLIRLAEHTRDLAHLTDAIGSASRLPRTPGVEWILGTALRVRYEFTGDHAALVDAAAALRRGVAAIPVDDPDHAGVLSELGNVLQLSAEHTGDEPVRESGIRYLRAAVDSTPSTSPLLPSRTMDLSAALLDRGRRTGDVAALTEAVVLARAALAASAPGTRWAGSCRANLLLTLECLFERTGDAGLLDEAIEIGGSAPAGDPAQVTLALLLGNAHHARFLRAGAETDLRRAITALSDVVETVPYGEVDHVVALANLGRIWLSDYGIGHDPESLRRSVAALGTAVRASAPETSLRAGVLFDYGNALVAEFGHRGDPATLAAAGHAFLAAAEIEAWPPLARITAARAWANTEAGADRWPRARDAFAFAVGLLPLAVSRGLVRADQQRTLAQLDGLAADAAAVALWADDPETAVRLLELGRGQLGGQLLQSRSDLSRLHAVAPELARRLSGIFDRLPPSRPLAGAAADERHHLDIELRQVLAEVRALPGMADFLAPPELGALLACTVDGPVVLINVSGFRSDALIVRPAGITTVELPRVTPEAVADRVTAFDAALAASARPGPEETGAQTVITEILGWLWDAVAEPVLERLGHTAAPPGDWPRVWWSPIGRLALLPIHAAGRFPDGAAVLDRVVSSYTPTLRALQYAKSRATNAEGDLAIVAIGAVPGGTTLGSVRREAADIAALTPATTLRDAAATVDAVRAALGTHASVHFACHAASDPDDPSAGHLVVHDGRLSVLDISALDLSGARLAVLSACETSRGTQRIPDEGLHLVSAFQLAGFPQVIGTLWQVNDLVARQVAVELHRGIAAGEDAATALHHAVRGCRERYAAAPALWAAHLHSGR
ncbi:CHAT domain-containing protein [Nocardia sp. NPDC050697]|uniref:CHAT domain-containing protein n=1 Tax=Nocardia sp. NPDC050697 TaxID=3155158 RepID=UPI0033EE3B35